MTRQEIYQDTPDHETGLTSSIGGLWPPERASFNRMKAFYTVGLVDSTESLNIVREEFRSCIEEMDNTISRIQFRAIVEGNFLMQQRDFNFFQKHLEAIIPLDEGQLGEKPLLIYFGKNTNIRQPQDEDLKFIKENLRNAIQVERRTVPQIMNKAELNGYSVETLYLPSEPSLREQTIDQLSNLYLRFGWDRPDVEEMIMNPNNLIAVARGEIQIVSAGIAEMANIPIGNNSLRMAEITEAATLNEHGSKGLYTAVSTHLILELVRRSQNQQIFGGEIDLIFGECNGLSAGVLKVVKFQGRAFAAEIGGEFGFPESGMLPQQVPISGAERNTKYNDLFPAFLTRSSLYQMYGR